MRACKKPEHAAHRGTETEDLDDDQPTTGYRYEDLHVGHALPQPGAHHHRCRPVGFAGLTGDFSELHTSDVYGKASQFGRRVAHGMLGLAYAHGLMWARTGELRETAIAFLGITDWKFVGPIFIGDTIFVNYRITELRDSRSQADAGDRDLRRRDREPGRHRSCSRARRRCWCRRCRSPPSPRRAAACGVTAEARPA